MTLYFADAAAEQAAGGVVRAGVFLYLQSSPALRLWSGFGDILPGINALDQSGEMYLGTGAFETPDQLGALLNGQAERANFALSGVDDNTFRLVERDAESVEGAMLSVGLCAFDNGWQQTTDVFWAWFGFADTVTLSRRGGVRTIGLSVGSWLTRRQKGNLAYYTDLEQKRRSATDRACERVANMSNTDKSWPRF